MDPFLGEIRTFSWNWAPKNWLICDGSVLAITQYTAMFSLMGTNFGGDGLTTFAIPDLRGRAIAGFGSTTSNIGTKDGQEYTSLSISTIPAHAHYVCATTENGDFPLPKSAFPATPLVGIKGYTESIYSSDNQSTAQVTLPEDVIETSGSDTPHINMQPSVVVNFCIASQGLYPTRS